MAVGQPGIGIVAVIASIVGRRHLLPIIAGIEIVVPGASRKTQQQSCQTK
jgi:hypothetical protein